MENFESLLRYYQQCLYFESYNDVKLKMASLRDGILENIEEYQSVAVYATLQKEIDADKTPFVGYPILKHKDEYIPLCMCVNIS